MRAFFELLIIAAFVVLISSSAAFADVKNERVRQEGNRIVFEYDLEGDKEGEVGVTITIDNKKHSTKELHLEGDIGKVAPGKGKRVYWNVLQDFPRGLSGSFEANIFAGRAEIPGMVFVKGGCFDMGDTFGGGYADERPVHKVCVDDFYIGKYEVTQREWVEVMGNNPSYFKNCDDCPMVKVSWNDANEFIKRLNHKTGGSYRLPTEAEWEYAARSGGKKEQWAGTSNKSELDKYAWYTYKSGLKTKPVGQKRPNGLGLYDMSGNVSEWVSDFYVDNYYQNSPRNNPKGPQSGSLRVHRGGGWGSDARGSRATSRFSYPPESRNRSLGFRLVRTK